MFLALLNYFSCVTFWECVGHSKNNETMHIITFLELSSGKKNQPSAVFC